VELILREDRGAVAILTLNRPEKRNALDDALRGALAAALGDVEQDEGVRVIVLTGAGDKAFAAGADLKELGARSVAEQALLMTQPRIFDLLAAVRRPVVAAVNGACLGGGLELALACDIRIAAAGATFGAPEVRLGLIPGGGGTQRLPRIIGTGAAMRLVLAGDAIDATEALRLGLVDEVASGDVVARAVELAERIARNGPVAVVAAKEAIRSALSMPLEQGLRAEAALFLLAFASADRTEGIAAFLEKRAAEFPGR
jgi:enoyl-CoA hydratase